MPTLPDLLPGEDRSYGPGLSVDLAPTSCWFTDAQFCLSPADWEMVQEMVIGRSRARCETCGAPAVPDQGVGIEVHQRWEYDHTTHVQSLRRLMSMCTRCHRATHFDIAVARGREEQSVAHLRAINQWDQETVQDHIEHAHALWEHRSRSEWKLDLSVLADAGLTPIHPPDEIPDDQPIPEAVPAAEPEPVPVPAIAAPAPAVAPDSAPAYPPQPAVPLPPPGWSPDPSGRYPMRFWDGATWSPHVVTPYGQYLIDPLPQ